MAYIKSASCSSSSVPTGSRTYDVFLSFRGDDTRYNFVDHLYAALVQRGICVFKDDEELRKGKAIYPELQKAIEESRFAVVVFSKNYANSSWCLAELAIIMKWHKEMGQKVIPVFYHVDPSDIRGQKNEVAVFFLQHDEKFREQINKVKEWRDSLTAAANLAGHHISEAIKEGESTYIKRIVDEILGDLEPPNRQDNLVGIESHMDALISLLETKEKEEVRMIGIYGMGGIGKTTIAKVLFKKIAHKFEGSSFLNDVRENSSSKRDICALQEKVLREILMTNHSFNVRDPEDGANMIRARFVHKKVLIVLDDIDNDKQLEFLAATHDSFGPGSRIIITTRNEHLLSDANAKYQLPCLLKDEALELFCRHAFRRNTPLKGYEELSCRAIRYAGYLPLAVKVLGAYFRGRETYMCESALDRLAKEPDLDIFETLKLSFDGLEVSEKKIFLDIACFYKEESVGHVTRILDCCGFDPQIGIRVLAEKSLITIYHNTIYMHDLIQEMGWQIVRKSFPNSRLWQLNDIHDYLENNQKLKEVEAIVVSNKKYDAAEYEEKVGFSPSVFESMKNLRLLDIRGRFTSSEPTFFPNKLQWLRWSECPFSSLQFSQTSKLVHLEISGAVKQFWNGQKIMANLKTLKLEKLYSLTMLPDVSVAPNIEKLVLSSCTNLIEVHESLGSHKRILKLYIIGCEGLKTLPFRFEMQSLKYLNLTKCSSLEQFPDVSPCMVNLSVIKLDYCSSIKGSPSSFGYLSSLDHLSLRRYPEEHGFVRNLLGCDAKIIESLPKPINLHAMMNLCSLRVLKLSGRQMESEDLENLHAFPCLEDLDLSGNNKLMQLPASISQLSRLRMLYLNECRGLQILRGLPSTIQKLEANDCCSLEKIEDLSKELDWWDRIFFINCQKLVKDEDSERYLRKMLHQSFLMRCAVVDRRLMIVIPGNKIPSLFNEEKPGSTISLMIPPKCNTQIIGIATCCVFHDEGERILNGYGINIYFEKDGKSISQEEVDCINVSENGNTLLISYIPFSDFGGFSRERWSGRGLKICVPNRAKAVRCAGRLIYKEDIELIN